MDSTTFEWALRQSVAARDNTDVESYIKWIGIIANDSEWYYNPVIVSSLYDETGPSCTLTTVHMGDDPNPLPLTEELVLEFLEHVYLGYRYTPVESFPDLHMFSRVDRLYNKVEYSDDQMTWNVQDASGGWHYQNYDSVELAYEPYEPITENFTFEVEDSSEDPVSDSEVSSESTDSEGDQTPVHPPKRQPPAKPADMPNLRIDRLGGATGAPTTRRAGTRRGETSRKSDRDTFRAKTFRKVKPAGTPRVESGKATPSGSGATRDNNPGRVWSPEHEAYLALDEQGMPLRVWSPEHRAFLALDEQGNRLEGRYYRHETDPDDTGMSQEEYDEYRAKSRARRREVDRKISENITRVSKRKPADPMDERKSEDYDVRLNDPVAMDPKLFGVDAGDTGATPVIYFKADSILDRVVIQATSDAEGRDALLFRAFESYLQDRKYGWILDIEHNLFVFDQGLEIFSLELDPEDERSLRRATAADTQLQYLLGKGMLTWGDVTRLKKDPGGNKYDFRYRHSSHSSGEPVICAGILELKTTVENGINVQRISHINNDSGHYAPTAGNLSSAVKILTDKGWMSPLSDVEVVGKNRAGAVVTGVAGTYPANDFIQAAELAEKYEQPLATGRQINAHRNVSLSAAAHALRHPATRKTANEALLANNSAIVATTRARFERVVAGVRKNPRQVSQMEWSTFESYLERTDQFRNIRYVVNSAPITWTHGQVEDFCGFFKRASTSPGYDNDETEEDPIDLDVALCALKDDELSLVGMEIPTDRWGMESVDIGIAEVILDPEHLDIEFAESPEERRRDEPVMHAGDYSSDDG
ncbi:hypothetical protein AB0D08_21220 [Kitasatospora sp. NPDC048540]|uniref:hypothetical protein n=1 Tax=Kitasatospora sp. NPDC048540 TaxID=3155634 RepID=UPI0033F35F82